MFNVGGSKLEVSRLGCGLLLAVLAGGPVALAQTNNQVPGPTDYAAFSRFITDRNIFDPNRQPHSGSTPRLRTRTHVSPSAPAFALVGTIGYEKGRFAFFSGNDADLKKVLPVDATIAGYTITDISQGRVTLTATNQAGTLALKVGDVLRQEGGKWALSTTGELPVESSGAAADPTPGGENAAAGAAASPVSAGEPNDILKRLMQKREQENK